jgi:hypothetical protein
MATQATYYERYGAVASPGYSTLRGVSRERGDPYRLRELPNEDVYFYRKPIDNSRIVRKADPQGRTRCWKLIATTCMATLLLIGLLWPNVAGMLAGYEIESLREEQQRLTAERAALELEEARLLSPERLEELARIQAFIDPAPEQVVYLNPKADGSLALNVGSK